MTRRKQPAFAAKIQFAPKWLRDHRGESGTDNSTEIKLQPSQGDGRGQLLVRHNFRDKRTPGRSTKGEADADQKDARQNQNTDSADPVAPSTASMPAEKASQRFIAHSNFLRSTRSAREPAGRVKKKSGSEATVAMTEMRNFDDVSVFIIQVAAVS